MGTGTPTFWTGSTIPSTFHDEKVKNLLSSAVNRGDLWRLNYNKTVFGALNPTGRAHDAFPDSRIGWEGIPLPCFPPLSSRDQRVPSSPFELVPHFLDQSYAPGATSLPVRVPTTNRPLK